MSGYGCDGCLVSNKGQQQNLQQVLDDGKKYAIENEKTVAIYKEGLDYKYCDAATAYANNYPIIKILSKHK
jgi:hypothetical protein